MSMSSTTHMKLESLRLEKREAQEQVRDEVREAQEHRRYVTHKFISELEYNKLH